MKNRTFFRFAAVFTLLISLASCGLNGLDFENPFENIGGDIPGLGNAEGEMTGTPFSLPAGVTLTGEISGGGDYSGHWDMPDGYGRAYTFTEKDGTTRSAVQTRADVEIGGYFGSGDGYVDLLIPLRNGNTSQTTVTFPAGLILRSVSGDCQNGVLIKKVTVTIPAATDYTICLSFYCGNLWRSSAYEGDGYVWGVVSNAAKLLELCELVKNKKINIEEFDPADSAGIGIYRAQVDMLQSIVWNITDWGGLTEDDKEYIESLPNS